MPIKSRDIAINQTCIPFSIKDLQKHRKIISKKQLIENKEVTLFVQLNW